MVFPVVGGNQSSGDLITNSLRFNSGDSADLQFTPSSAGTEETFTISAWIKKSMVGANNGQDCYLFSSQADSNNRTIMGVFGSSSTQGIFFENKVSGTSSYVDSSATFRDPNAWMHCVWAIDTTQSTNTNRVKLYVNGSQITSFDSTSYPNQNVVTQWSRAQVNYIGSRAGGNYYDGYMAEVHVIDGSQLAPTQFGETNDNGVWVPIEYTGSYGTNGYYLQFKGTGTSQNSSGIGADTSGNDNHFAVSNLTATDVTTDTPQNNFTTGNPLILIAGGNITPSFSEGNTKWTSGANSSYGTSGHGNMAVTNGKWYWEMKIDAGRNNGVTCGIAPTSVFENHYGTSTSTDYTFARDNLGSYGYQFTNSGSTKVTGTSGGNSSSYGTNWSVDDIIGVAMDLDNDTLTFYLNGTSQNEAFSSLPDVYYTPAWYGYYDTVWEFNAGNPYNAISSGNSDANGYGNFEYAVPSGFYSLCTKNLAEFG